MKEAREWLDHISSLKQGSPRAWTSKGTELLAEFRAREGLVKADDWKRPWLRNAAEVLDGYAALLRRQNALDFDDLLAAGVTVLANGGVHATCRRKWRHILVDEVQDTNALQYELLRLLSQDQEGEMSEGGGGSLFVVGDLDQSIYGWRGAQPQLMHQVMLETYGGVDCLELSTNYRCTHQIVEAGRAVLTRASTTSGLSLRAHPGAKPGVPLRVVLPFDPASEANDIAAEIARLHPSGDAEKVLGLDSVAVLHRTRRQSREIERALLERGISCKVVGGTSFFERAEVKDLVTYLRLTVNSNDDVGLIRIINVPKRKVGRATLERLQASRKAGEPLTSTLEREAGTHAGLSDLAEILAGARRRLQDGASPGDVLSFIIERTSYEQHVRRNWRDQEEQEERCANVQQLLELAQAREGGGPVALHAFLEEAAGLSPESSAHGADLGKGAVKVMTMHSAKGTEFDTVFIAGAAQVLIPSWRAVSQDDLDEEARLFYVACTRARSRLYISSPQYIYGAESDPSVFLMAILDAARGVPQLSRKTFDIWRQWLDVSML
mmetsp:Transcript_46310/g.104994  ORF Transcript_46310/g.104994 Transcript_46310/m.104994 type:complete len:552 (+) Transcript_46310:1-1656(+)